MEFIKFKEQTHVLGEDQEQYNGLPVHIDEDEEKTHTACIQFTEDELDIIRLNGNKLWYSQLTFGYPFQPINIMVEPPIFEPGIID